MRSCISSNALEKIVPEIMKGVTLRGLLGLFIILVGVNLACSARSLDQLDPKIFGYANDTSSSRTVTTGADLAATLSDVTVSTIILNGVFLHRHAGLPKCAVLFVTCNFNGCLKRTLPV